MKTFIASLSAAACLLLSTSAQAIPYKIDFTVSGFGPGIFAGSAAPQNTVTGAIFFSADALGGAIKSIDAVDLTIAGHAYTPDEIGSGFYSDGYLFGAKANGVGVTRTNSDDFYLIVSSSFKVFAYAQASAADTWTSRNISASYAEVIPPASSVPEPGMLALLGLGTLGAALARRRS